MSSLQDLINYAQLTWKDGLPYSSQFDDIYFASQTPIEEKNHVFIKSQQLVQRWQALSEHHAPHFVIGETGFGCGLTFLLTWFQWRKFAPKTAKLYYFSCEKYPLTKEDLKCCMDLWPSLYEEANLLLETYPTLTPGFHALNFDEGRVTLILMLGDALSTFKTLLTCGDSVLESKLRCWSFDAWFLDGFAPAKNSDMWKPELLITLNLLSKPETTLASYTAAGEVRRGLQEVGFNVSKQKGYAGKRQMIVATYAVQSQRKIKRDTPWHTDYLPAVKQKKAIIVGAGLAGCYTAYALAKRGWHVIIVDKQPTYGAGASGNHHALIYPQLSAYRSPLIDFMLSAFLYAVRCYHSLLKQETFGELNGILQLPNRNFNLEVSEAFSKFLAHYPELGKCVSVEEASLVAGIALTAPGLFISQSGWINIPGLCRTLINHPGIECQFDTQIEALNYQDGMWHTNQHHAGVLVVANGHLANQFIETAHLPLKSIHGQTTWIKSTSQSHQLKIPLSGEAHIVPAKSGVHGIGATYSTTPGLTNTSRKDDEINLKRLDALPVLNTIWSNQVVNNWSGIRGATPDYLPLVGPVPHAAQFKSDFAGFSTDSKRWIGKPGSCFPGLFICAGFGSRGLTSIPLSAESLAGMINREPQTLPRSMLQSLSPARFLRQELIVSKVF